MCFDVQYLIELCFSAFQMRARPDWFIGDSFAKVPEDIQLMQLIAKSLKQFDQLFQDEKKAAPNFAKVWANAEEQYKSVFESLKEPQQKFLLEKLPTRLPEELKKNAHYLPVAVIASTSSRSGFFKRFNNKTRQLLSGEEKWQRFKFKSLLILLTYALKYLPGQPSPAAKKVIFRGMDCESPPEEGEVFCMGHFGSFTTRRGIALGKLVRTLWIEIIFPLISEIQFIKLFRLLVHDFFRQFCE